MGFGIRRSKKWVASFLILSLVISLGGFGSVTAAGGSLQLALFAYGTVRGVLQNTTMQPTNAISMIMIVNDQIQTQNGPLQVTASSIWNGTRNGSAVSGLMGRINGEVAGVLEPMPFEYLTADFLGEGRWNGQLNGSHGSGTFEGTITFVNSLFSQMPIDQPFFISGNWTAEFELSVPEFGPGMPTYMLMFTIATLVLFIGHTPKMPKGSSEPTMCEFQGPPSLHGSHCVAHVQISIQS
jgi:hypothetical protein